MFRIAGSIKDLCYAVVDGCLQRKHAGFRREYSDKSFGKNKMNDPCQRPTVTAFSQPGGDHGNIKKMLCKRQQRGGQITGQNGNISLADKGALKSSKHAHVRVDNQRCFSRLGGFTHCFHFPGQIAPETPSSALLPVSVLPGPPAWSQDNQPSFAERLRNSLRLHIPYTAPPLAADSTAKLLAQLPAQCFPSPC